MSTNSIEQMSDVVAQLLWKPCIEYVKKPKRKYKSQRRILRELKKEYKENELI